MSMSTPEVPKGRIAQLRQAYGVTKQQDRWIGLILLAWFVVVGGLAGTGSWLLGSGVNTWVGLGVAIVVGLLAGFLAAMIVFGRRAEKAAYKQVEGQVGAAAGALQMLKRGWFVAPAVAFTKQQDLVHRVVGRPGIILVGEGNPNRVRGLLATEKKKHARISGEAPIVDLIVGDDEGQVPLPKLFKKVRKQPKALKAAELTPLMNKIKALDAMRPAAPIPKGPVPTSMKGARKMMQGR